MVQMTLLTGPERRRRWSKEERLRILAKSLTRNSWSTGEALDENGCRGEDNEGERC